MVRLIKNARLGRSSIRLLKSAGDTVGRVGDKAASGLFRWATTDHTGLSQRLNRMPVMGFFDSVKYILLQLAISIMVTVVTAALAFFLIAYGIPYFLFGSL